MMNKFIQNIKSILTKIRNKLPAKLKYDIKNISLFQIFIAVISFVFLFSCYQIAKQIIDKTYDEKIFEINEKEDDLSDVFEDAEAEYNKVINDLDIQIQAENLSKNATENNQTKESFMDAIMKEWNNKKDKNIIKEYSKLDETALEEDIKELENTLNTIDNNNTKTIPQVLREKWKKEKEIKEKILKVRMEQKR